MSEYTTKPSECQVLIDRSASGKVRPWTIHKTQSEYLSAVYQMIDPNKSARLDKCATWLTYARKGERMRLVHADFCRVRLCPICQWRRSLKLYGQMTKVLDYLGNGYAYVFLTLTMRNVEGEHLNGAIDDILIAFNLFRKYKDCKCFQGYFRGLEVTRNQKDGTYHPHLHVLLAVKPSYFKSRYYLSQERITELWKRALGVDYTPIVDVRRVKGNDPKAIAEAAKYSVKPGDYLYYDDFGLSEEVVRLLDRVFANRRFCGFGGVIQEARKRLALDDEDGDLVDIGISADEIKSDERDELIFVWHTGLKQYIGE